MHVDQSKSFFLTFMHIHMNYKSHELQTHFLRVYSSNLPPSQGGKYSGFGNTPMVQPKNQSQEILDATLSSLVSVSLFTLRF